MLGNIFGILGNFYLRVFKLEKAISCYEKALKHNTKNAISLYNFAIVLLQKGDAKRALELLEKARILNKKPLFEKLIILAMSSCYWKTNRLSDAIDILEKLRKDYDYVSQEALTTLGFFYMLNKDFEKALEISKMALGDEKNYASAWDNIGQIYFFQQDYEKAKENFLKSIEFNAYSIDSLYYLGILEEMENNNQKAKEYFERASKCKITALNTISKEDLIEKLNKYNITYNQQL